MIFRKLLYVILEQIFTRPNHSVEMFRGKAHSIDVIFREEPQIFREESHSIEIIFREEPYRTENMFREEPHSIEIVFREKSGKILNCI